MTLKILTYMFPDLPLELYQTYQRLLEKVLSVDSLLIIENRSKNLWKTLDSGDVDIAFLSSTNYVNLKKNGASRYRLIDVAPIFDLGSHQLQSHSEVIVPKSEKESFKTFEDLIGRRLAVTDCECIFGYSGVLGELKKMGLNAHFFGDYLHTKSQRDVIESVLNRSADVGSVQSFVLENWKRENPERSDEFEVVTSWGPYAPDPIVLNRELPGEIDIKVTQALLNLSTNHPEFVESFQKFGIMGFQKFDPQLYLLTSELLEIASAERLYPTYY